MFHLGLHTELQILLEGSTEGRTFTIGRPAVEKRRHHHDTGRHTLLIDWVLSTETLKLWETNGSSLG